MAKHPLMRRAKAVSLPIMGKAQHNAGIQILIGGLVINWANNESVFLAMLQSLIGGGEQSASIVWNSLRTTAARTDLVWKLAREQIRDANLLKDISAALERFKSLSKTRNFYCHATYSYDSELNLVGALGVTMAQEGDPIRYEEKRLDRAAVNEINQAILGLADLNQATWALIPRLETALGVQRVKRPQLLDELQRRAPDVPEGGLQGP